MSRIGRLPIKVPAGVTVEITENNKVTVTGPKGFQQKWKSNRKAMKTS